MATSERMPLNLGSAIRISPALWPGKEQVVIQPGDLSRITRQGNGVYGYQGLVGSGNIFTGAPTQEPSGGVVYFENDISRDDLEVLLRVLGVESQDGRENPRKDFSVFVGESEEPGKDGYIAQMRIVSKFALRFMFGIINEAKYEGFPKQELAPVDAL